MNRSGFKFAYVDGCLYGVESVVREELIQNKWKFAYLNCDFAEVLRRRNKKCDGTHDHVHCQGKDTGLTGWNPTGLSSDVHECFAIATGTCTTSTTSTTSAAAEFDRTSSKHQALPAMAALPTQPANAPYTDLNKVAEESGTLLFGSTL